MGSTQLHEDARFVKSQSHSPKFTVGSLDMLDAAATLQVHSPTIMFVDANSGATEDLTLANPASDGSDEGLVKWIINSGGESIVLKNVATTTLKTIATAQGAMCMVINGAWVARLMT